MEVWSRKVDKKKTGHILFFRCDRPRRRRNLCDGGGPGSLKRFLDEARLRTGSIYGRFPGLHRFRFDSLRCVPHDPEKLRTRPPARDEPCPRKIQRLRPGSPDPFVLCQAVEGIPRRGRPHRGKLCFGGPRVLSRGRGNAEGYAPARALAPAAL